MLCKLLFSTGAPEKCVKLGGEGDDFFSGVHLRQDSLYLTGYSTSSAYKQSSKTYGHFVFRFNKNLNDLDACMELQMNEVSLTIEDSLLDLREITGLSIEV